MKKKNALIAGIMFGLAVAVILFLLKNRGENEIESEQLYISNRGNCSTDQGFFYIDQEEFLQFYDYESGLNTIVCNKPNCEHKSWQGETPEEQRCNAYISACQSLFVFNGKLYVVEKEINKNTLQIVESEPDRSKQRILAKLDCEYIGSYVIDKGKMYFSTLTSKMEKDESGMPVQTGISLVTICSLDMSDGLIEELYTMEEHYNAQLSILGIYNGRIYCFYSFFQKKFTGLNFQEAQYRVFWYTYDVESGELKQELEELTDIDINLCVMSKEKIIYGMWNDRDAETSDLYCYDIETEENKRIISDSYNFVNFDDKVIAVSYDKKQYTIFDMKTETTYVLKPQETEFSILAEHEDEFIGALYQNGEATYGRMKKQEYYKGNMEFQAFSQ